MARQSNSELLNEYRQRYGNSRRIVTDNYSQTWARLINLYRGKQYNNAVPFDRMLVNMAFATIRQYLLVAQRLLLVLADQKTLTSQLLLKQLLTTGGNTTNAKKSFS